MLESLLLFLTLIWVEVGVVLPPPPPPPPYPCWFSLNNPETVQAVTLPFCSFQQLFIRDICAKFGIPNLPQSPDTGQNSDGGISDFRMSGQSLINENCRNSRTSYDIDMKLGPVTKMDKRNMTTSKKPDVDVMSVNCNVAVFFPIYGQFAAIRKPHSGGMVYKTYISINKTLCPTKTENKTKKSLAQLSYYCFK